MKLEYNPLTTGKKNVRDIFRGKSKNLSQFGPIFLNLIFRFDPQLTAIELKIGPLLIDFVNFVQQLASQLDSMYMQFPSQ